MSESDRELEGRGAVAAETLLRRLFDIIAEEAARNPDLMVRLMNEIVASGGAAPIQVEAPAPAAAPAKRKTRKPAASKPVEAAAADDELAGFNPIAIASDGGAAALRDELRFIKRKDPLARVAKRYALDVPMSVLRKKASLADMVEAIVTASEKRVREQHLSGG